MPTHFFTYLLYFYLIKFYNLSTEVLSDPAIASKLSDTKASGEVKALEDFYTMLQVDSNKAYYG